jgi:LysM repeat protein
MEEEKTHLQPTVEKKAWLSGVRFSCLLACCLVNVFLLVGVFLMKEEGCVICLSTTPDAIPPVIVQKNIFSDPGKELLLKLKNASQNDLISSLTSEEKVGFGYSEGDIAASFLYARGFDFEPVLKAFSAWPMTVFLVSCNLNEQEGSGLFELPLFSGLTQPMKSSLQEYFVSKKAPYRLEYVLQYCSEKEDFAFAEEALSHRSDVRLWLSLYQLWHLSKEESWKTILAMKKEAILRPPSERMSVGEVCFLFEKNIPSFLAKALVEYRMETCVALDDEPLEKLISSLQENPKMKARLALKLLQVPRKEAIHQHAKKIVAELAQEPKLELMSVEDLMAYFKAPKVEKNIQSPPSLHQPLVKSSIPETKMSVSKAEPKTAKVSPHCTLYTVQKGDTIWKIAQKYKIDPNKISSLNNLKKGQLAIGQKLRIPLP